MIFDHLGLHVRDLPAAVRFYEAALAPLGHVAGPTDAEMASFGASGAPALWLYQRGRGTHGEGGGGDLVQQVDELLDRADEIAGGEVGRLG